MRAQQEDGRVRVPHRLTETASDPTEIAPWAITQLVPGGEASAPAGEFVAALDLGGARHR